MPTIRQLFCLLSLFALQTDATAAYSDHDFDMFAGMPTGSWPDAIAIGDVDGDGRNDVVLVTTTVAGDANDFMVFVYLQKANGYLASPVKYPYSQPGNTANVKLADLNRDSILDVVVGHGGGLTLLLTDGANGLTSSEVAVEHDCVDLAIADIDRDGNPDVVCQGWSKNATLFFGNGTTGFRSSSSMITGASGNNDLKMGDVTGDGLPDIVIVSQNATHFYVYPHNGSDGFGPERAYPVPDPIGLAPGALAIGDFDHDGRNDIAMSSQDDAPNYVWLYRQNASGKLEGWHGMMTAGRTSALAAADLDRDGLQDLLTLHIGQRQIGRYMQGTSGPGNEILITAPSDGYENALAIGDLDENGCPDVAEADFNSGLVLLYGKNCKLPAAKHDFDGDGKSDILWRNGVTGANAIWKSASYGQQQAVTGVSATNWKVVGDGDFDGDGRADLLWHNTNTGANTIWKSGNYHTQQAVVQITDLGWKVDGVGDFNGDMKADILWRHAQTGRNAIWLSGDYRAQQSITVVSNLQWKTAGVGDFNGDGESDILWRHAISGANTIWLSGKSANQIDIVDVTQTVWQVAGIGDFDRDRRADILWRNARTGSNVIWQNGDYSLQRPVSLVSDIRWQVAAIGDYDADNESDIVWRHASTGQNEIWRSGQSGTPLPMTDIANREWFIASP